MKMRLFLLVLLAALLLPACGMTAGQVEPDDRLIENIERDFNTAMDQQDWKTVNLQATFLLIFWPESEAAKRVIERLGVNDAEAALALLDQKSPVRDDHDERKDFCLSSNPHNDDKEARVNTVSRRLNPPRHPQAALLARVEGRVWLSIDVDDKGNPTSIVVGSSSGSDALDQAALEAARNWNFCPAIQGGQSTPGQFQASIVFSMT